MFLLQMERRVDHWLRPTFDAILRDPIARLVTALINMQRKDEGLKIAEEKALPNEEEYLSSIIESFTTQMRGLWKPGGVSTPTFVTQDVKSNAHLQKWSVKNAQIFHFVNFEQPHILDMIMQGLWVKTQSSPFEAPYFSCVPYLLGDGQAMQYSVWPKTNKKTPIPRLPLRPPDDYLRDAMVKALNEGDVELDFRLQLQTDPFLMPIENNGVLWPEKLSPRVSVATLRLPKQKFDSPAQMEFAKKLSYNPWHTIAEHRPLGNQSRARQQMYYELSKLRHDMNKVPHYEPTGNEVFD